MKRNVTVSVKKIKMYVKKVIGNLKNHSIFYLDLK